MAQSFPTSIPDYPDTTGDEVLGTAGDGKGLSGILDDYGLDIAAIATKLGTGADTPASGQVLRGNGAGTSEWADLDLTTDVTGVLPAANGGTGLSALGTGVATFLGTPSSANLASAVTDETGSGALVFGTSPTIVTPTIASFANATHNHLNAAGGGALGAGAATPGIWTNPYCFRAYDSGGTTLTDNTVVQINLATEVYDYNNNFASSAYTAPVAGVYHFNGAVSISGAVATGVTAIIYIYVNGAEHTRGGRLVPTDNQGMVIGADMLLAAGDVVTLRFLQDSAGGEATTTGSNLTWFSGHLVHAT